MKIHIFNPDHDMALAANDPLYVSKQAGRQLAADLAWLPSIYADEGDIVLVDFEDCRELEQLSPEQVEFVPWGWNRQIVHRLAKRFPHLRPSLPTDDVLQLIRERSSRAWAAEFFKSGETAVGREARACRSYEELLEALATLPEAMVKQPWSGSGRGLRHITRAEKICEICEICGRKKEVLRGLEPHLEGWCRNTIERQGCIMVEPYYNKVLDLAAEFFLDADGQAVFLGTSVFKVHNGYYMGNVLATEEEKMEMIGRYIPVDTYREAVARLTARCASLVPLPLPFGIDMMIVQQDDGGYRLHPMVELNLRRTMGHVAIAMQASGRGPRNGYMQIEYKENKYRLTIQ